MTLSGNIAPLKINEGLSHKLANMSFVCSLLVVAIHIGIPGNTGSLPWWCVHLLRSVLGSVAVPFFFTASGFLLAGHVGEEGWYVREMGKRLKSLLIPYVAWLALFSVYLIPVTLASNMLHHEPLASRIVMPSPIAVFGLDLAKYPAIPAFWYLRYLMILCAVSPLLVWAVDKWRWKAVVAACVCMVIHEMVVEFVRRRWGFFQQPWMLNPYGLFYFLAGMAWRLGMFPPISMPAKRSAIMLGVVVFFAKIGGLALMSAGEDTLFPLASHEWWHLVWNVPLVFCAWSLIPATPWPRLFVKNTFPIYVSHVFFLDAFHKIMCFSCLDIVQDWRPLLEWGGAVLGSVSVACLLRRFAPWIAQIMYGKR